MLYVIRSFGVHDH